MAVVTKYGTGARDPASLLSVSAHNGEASVKAINSTLAITNGDSINSIFFIGRVPSDAIIDPRSIYYHAALTGLTDLDIGFYRNGVLVDIDALVDGDDVSAAGNHTFLGHGNPWVLATTEMRAWQIAGLAADPACMLDIVATLKAAAGATGNIKFIIWYYKK